EDPPPQQLVLLLQDRVRLAQLLELSERARLLLLERLALGALVARAVLLRAQQRLARAPLLTGSTVQQHQLAVRAHERHHARARVDVLASSVSVITGSPVKTARIARSVPCRPLEAEPREEVRELALAEHHRR